jgi:phosphatidylethanolamine/phosphatidyl-N-methylethanolamine N-methyltransferase
MVTLHDARPKDAQRAENGAHLDTTLGTRWERSRYALWAPLYDIFVWPLRNARRRSLDGLGLRAGERVLIVGGGTGEDLPLIPAGVFTVVTDLTPAMLRRARPKMQASHHLAVMDGHSLALRGGTFDAVVLHLILAVIPNPALCLAEAVRVLRPGGRIAIFDKFVAGGGNASRGRRLLNRITRAIATDITRRLDDIIRDSEVRVSRVTDEPAVGGRFSVVQLRRE